MTLPMVGLQTIVFGKQYSIEDPKVLDHVVACGYQAVETGVQDPAAFKRMLDARNMRYAGGHTGPKALMDPQPTIDTLQALDAHDMCSSGLMDWSKRSADDYRETIEILNRVGTKLRAADIRLHYHNHAFEFEAVEGDRTGMDLLLDGLDPAAVDLCVDIGWVTKAGSDPVEFLLKHKERVAYLHFKDFNDDGWIELGGGKVNFSAVMKILPELTGVRWVIVEQDSARIDPLESAALSRQYLRDTFAY